MIRVYNGIELAKFSRRDALPRVPGRAEARPSVRLLSVGRLVPFKGFDVLIAACAELRRRDLAFSCEIIGDGPLREDLQAQIAKENLHEHVHLSGERAQDYVLDALAQCDLFVLAACVDERGASDVFPTVIAEAMTRGRAVVSTSVAGIPELVAADETGLLVPPRNSSALAGAITRLMADGALRERMGTAGRRRIEEHFTIEKTIEPFLAALTARASVV